MLEHRKRRTSTKVQYKYFLKNRICRREARKNKNKIVNTLVNKKNIYIRSVLSCLVYKLKEMRWNWMKNIIYSNLKVFWMDRFDGNRCELSIFCSSFEFIFWSCSMEKRFGVKWASFSILFHHIYFKFEFKNWKNFSTNMKYQKFGSKS